MFRRAGQVLVGSVGGFSIGLAVMPLFSRIYSPEQFGQYAVVLAAASTVVGFSTLRSEIIAQKQSSDSSAKALIRFGLVSAVSLAGITTVSALAAYLVLDVPWEWLSLGLLIAFGAFQFIGAAACTIRQRYSQLALQNFIQQAGTPASQTLLGLLGPGPLTLVAGFVLSRAAWLVPIDRLLRKQPMISNAEVWGANWRYLIPAGGSALINSLSSQLIVLVGSFLYGAVEGGVIAMAVRVLVGPMLLIGQALSAATVGEFGRSLRTGAGNSLYGRYKKAVTWLFLSAALPICAVGVLAPYVVTPVLGSSWAAVGPVVSALCLGVLFQFSIAPFSQLMNLTSQSGALMRWDFMRFGLLALALVVPAALGSGLLVSMWAYSAAQVVCYIVLAFLIGRALKSSAFGFVTVEER